jgi:hypothetical protein
MMVKSASDCFSSRIICESKAGPRYAPHPRNRIAFDAAAERREKIRALLAAHRQDEPILTVKDVLRNLEWPDSMARTVRRHLNAIRARR